MRNICSYISCCHRSNSTNKDTIQMKLSLYCFWTLISTFFPEKIMTMKISWKQVQVVAIAITIIITVAIKRITSTVIIEDVPCTATGFRFLDRQNYARNKQETCSYIHADTFEFCQRYEYNYLTFLTIQCIFNNKPNQ